MVIRSCELSGCQNSIPGIDEVCYI